MSIDSSLLSDGSFAKIKALYFLYYIVVWLRIVLFVMTFELFKFVFYLYRFVHKHERDLQNNVYIFLYAMTRKFQFRCNLFLFNLFFNVN